jgi:hypothetical protein
MSKARVYADVNVQRPKEYWDYESLAVQWGYVCLIRSVLWLKFAFSFEEKKKKKKKKKKSFFWFWPSRMSPCLTCKVNSIMFGSSLIFLYITS